MPRICTICSHPKRSAIEAALVAGTSNRRIATHYGMTEGSVRRHVAEHVAKQIAQAQEAREEAQSLDVTRQLKVVNGVAMSILAEARRARAHDVALRAMDRIHKQLELQAKLLGQLDERPVVNVMLSPEWLHVRAAMLAALAPHPQARLDVAAALIALDSTGNGAGGSSSSNGHLN
jgi:hypothetical protein